jgi:peptidoglycan-associated lipoprotein
MFTRVLIATLVVLGVALNAGCAGKKKRTGPRDRAPSSSQTQGYPTTELGDDGQPTSPQPGSAQGIERSVVYFDYDVAEPKSGEDGIIQQHAAYLAKNTSVRVRLEGHCDERGTREYNIGLGERRSQTVQQRLLAAGVSQGQISVVSFGEERPAALGHDESAYSQNRRVEFIYP